MQTISTQCALQMLLAVACVALGCLIATVADDLARSTDGVTGAACSCCSVVSVVRAKVGDGNTLANAKALTCSGTTGPTGLAAPERLCLPASNRMCMRTFRPMANDMSAFIMMSVLERRGQPQR